MEVAPRCTPFTLFMLSKSLSLPLQLCVCPYILLGKVRTLLEWALLSKKWGDGCMNGLPLGKLSYIKDGKKGDK